MLKKILRNLCVFALFLIPLFPLIPLPGSFPFFSFSNTFFFPFITGKAFYFRILVELAFAAWAILAFYEPKYRPKLTPLTIGVSLFAVVALLADLLGVNPLRSLWSNFERMEGWITIIHLYAFYLVATSVFGSGEDGRRSWHRWLNMSLIVGAVVALYGIFQLAGWAEIHQGSRVDASLGNAAYMAVYMLFMAGMAAYLFFVELKKPTRVVFRRWLYAVAFVVFSFILFETATRGTILGLIGGILLACAVYALFGKNEPKKWRLVSACVIGLVVVIGVVFWLNRGSVLVQKNEVLRRMAAISWSDTSNQARQYIWPMAVNGALDRPILGWGQENFNYIFNADYNPKMWSQEQWFDRAHNVFLDWLVASGIVGFLAYCALYVLFLVSIWKSSLTLAEKSVLTGLLAAYAVHNIFVFDNLASYVMFFAFLGFAHSQSKNKQISWMGNMPVRADAVEYIVAPVAIVALVFGIYFYNVRPIEANKRLISGLQSCANQAPDAASFESALSVNVYVANQEIREQTLSCAGNVLSSQQTPGPTKQAFFTLATKAIKDQIAATPKDTRIYALAGSFMNSIGQFPDALTYLEKAHELSPAKQSVDLELATAYLNTASTTAALSLLDNAYKSATDNTMVQSAYAVALVLSGKESQAHTLFGDAPAIFGTAQMARVYASLKEYGKSLAIYRTLLAATPGDVNLSAQMAQVQYQSGDVAGSVATLRAIEKDHPEYKDQIEAAIKQAETQAGK